MKLYEKDIWRELQPDDKGKSNCTFCNKETIGEYTLWEGEHWLVIHNKYPILGLENHIMAIPKKHITLAHNISPEIMSEYPKVQKFIHTFFGKQKYFSFMRESIESRSLEHLHYHFVPGKIGYSDIEEFLKKQGF